MWFEAKLRSSIQKLYLQVNILINHQLSVKENKYLLNYWEALFYQITVYLLELLFKQSSYEEQLFKSHTRVNIIPATCIHSVQKCMKYVL